MAQLTLDAVQHEFDSWRASRTGKISKIPNDLWDKALQLLEHYPINVVMKALHLSGKQISVKRNQRIPHKSLSKTKFVELNMPQTCLGLGDNQTHNIPNKIEIKCSDGTALIIEQLAEQTILQVLTQFTQKVH